jgi:proteasome lid subunit RPN8/RPN11
MIPPPVRSTILRAIAQARQQEVCGYLISTANGNEFFWRLRNLSGQEGHFLIASNELDRVAHASRRNLYTIQAFVHSHTTSLEMSHADRLAFQSSDVPWVIVTQENGRIDERWYLL